MKKKTDYNKPSQNAAPEASIATPKESSANSVGKSTAAAAAASTTAANSGLGLLGAYSDSDQSEQSD